MAEHEAEKTEGLAASPKDADSATMVFGNEAREAVASLRGYVYQAYASAVAWLELGDDEILHLEVAEDYAVAARGALRGVQVKDTIGSGSLTLNSRYVAETLDGFVDLVTRNPRKSVTLTYLTTSEAGLEKAKADRVSDEAGLLYWQRAAEGADIAPLRRRLLELSITDRVRSFINARDDEALRSDLISRIKWLCGSPAITGLEKRIQDLLVTYGSSRNVLAGEAQKLADPVLVEILKASTHASLRQLNRADFIRLFDERTTTQIRNDDLTQLVRAAARPVDSQARPMVVDDYARVLLDQALAAEVINLRRKRFFAEARAVDVAKTLGEQVLSGRWKTASPAVRSDALGWAARLTINDANESLSRRFCEEAKKLDLSEAARIADAIIRWQSGDKAAGLRSLSEIGTPAALGAGLAMHINREGWAAGEAWRKAAGLDVMAFPPESLFFYIMKGLVAGEWETCFPIVTALAPEHFAACPALNGIAGIACLGMAVPREFRGMVLAGAPFAAETFALSDEPAAQALRVAAVTHFERSAVSCEELGVSMQRDIDQEYALWLKLRSPSTRSPALVELRERLTASNFSPRWLNLALRFGIEVDVPAAARELDRRTALQGGMDGDIALARLALALNSPTPQAALEKMAPYREDLYRHLNAVAVGQFEIQFLVKTGQRDRAHLVLETIKAKGITPSEEQVLEDFFSGSDNEDPAATWVARYEQDKQLSDLQVLVSTLEENGDTERLVTFAGKLFDETRSVKDAARYVMLLDRLNRRDALNAFLDTHVDIARQSTGLAERQAWSLLQRGDIPGCRAWLAETITDRATPNMRALRVSLAVTSGDWADLRSFLDQEYLARDQRTPAELLQAARLAVDIGHDKGREFLFAAVAKGSDSATFLATAFDTATKAGWDDSDEVVGWLFRAAELSDENGPVQQASIEDVAADSVRWQDYASEIWQRYQRGELPALTVARSLNRTLIDVTLRPATTNLETLDPRRRTPIPAFHGRRPKLDSFEPGRKAVFEPTSLLTLAHLDLLPKALALFEQAIVAHGSLAMFFEEKQRAAFHQPSQARKAREIQQLVLAGKLVVVDRDQDPPAPLVSQFGRDTALLLVEAQARNQASEASLVVRPGPIYVPGGFMRVKADTEAHNGVLSGCAPIVSALRDRGVLTEEKFEKAKAYLSLHEEPWPDQPPIPNGTVLLLDDLAISSLCHLGVLSLLRDAGFEPKILRVSLDRARDLTTYNNRADYIIDRIEHVRNSLADGINAGTVSLGQSLWDGENPEEDHQTLSAIQSLPDAELLVSDDRRVNAFGFWNIDGTAKPVITTVDLIDVMTSRGILTREERTRLRTKLRRSGYAFVPLEEEELCDLLKASAVGQGKLVETAELRAIRENLELLRMGLWLQWPDEAPWLQSLMSTLHGAIKKQWSEGLDVAVAAARSNWVLELMDFRDWGPSISRSADSVNEGRAMQIGQLAAPVPGWPTVTQQNFLDWLDESLLLPLRHNEPELFAAVVARVRSGALKVPTDE